MPKSRKRKLNRNSVQETEPARDARPDKRAAVRPGTFNVNGDFFTPEGVIIRRTREEVTPAEAAGLVRNGARVAFEGCGCGGGGGCIPLWPSSADAADAAAVGKPTFTDEYGSPTWIDVWQSEDQSVVFLHGDVSWGTIAG
jgi:hypothetical protein